MLCTGECRNETTGVVDDVLLDVPSRQTHIAPNREDRTNQFSIRRISIQLLVDLSLDAFDIWWQQTRHPAGSRAIVRLTVSNIHLTTLIPRKREIRVIATSDPHTREVLQMTLVRFRRQVWVSLEPETLSKRSSFDIVQLLIRELVSLGQERREILVDVAFTLPYAPQKPVEALPSFFEAACPVVLICNDWKQIVGLRVSP